MPKISLLLISWILIHSTLGHAQSSPVSFEGGKAVYCSQNSSVTVNTLNAYNEEADDDLVTANHFDNRQAFIDFALSRLKRLSPQRVEFYTSDIRNFFKQVAWVKPSEIELFQNKQLLVVPSGCKLFQIANVEVSNGQIQFKIDQEKWDLLGQRDQARLILYLVVKQDLILRDGDLENASFVMDVPNILLSKNEPKQQQYLLAAAHAGMNSIDIGFLNGTLLYQSNRLSRLVNSSCQKSKDCAESLKSNLAARGAQEICGYSINQNNSKNFCGKNKPKHSLETYAQVSNEKEFSEKRIFRIATGYFVNRGDIEHHLDYIDLSSDRNLPEGVEDYIIPFGENPVHMIRTRNPMPFKTDLFEVTCLPGQIKIISPLSVNNRWKFMPIRLFSCNLASDGKVSIAQKWFEVTDMAFSKTKMENDWLGSKQLNSGSLEWGLNYKFKTPQNIEFPGISIKKVIGVENSNSRNGNRLTISSTSQKIKIEGSECLVKSIDLFEDDGSREMISVSTADMQPCSINIARQSLKIKSAVIDPYSGHLRYGITSPNARVRGYDCNPLPGAENRLVDKVFKEPVYVMVTRRNSLSLHFGEGYGSAMCEWDED